MERVEGERPAALGHPPDIARSAPPRAPWRLLLRWRWWLAGIITFAFAAGRLFEALLLHQPVFGRNTLLDVLLWGLLGGLAVFVSLTWAGRQERRYEERMEASLAREQRLNAELQRANRHLALLSDVSQQIVLAASLDEVFDAALGFPQRLVPAEAAALWLHDSSGDVLTRVAGGTEGEIEVRRAAFGLAGGSLAFRQLDPSGTQGRDGGAVMLLPLHDGTSQVGWMELFLARRVRLAPDERALLHTIATEIAEAISSMRRRSREERAIYELEQALADERARIARDIHDGLAQTFAFQRMRVDLWLDWIEEDPARLAEELLALKVHLREQIAELRRAIFALRPVQFDELGFVGGLHRYITEFATQQNWEVQVDLSGLPPRLPPSLEATCFRLVQEALTNAAKHAAAARVAVRVEEAPGAIELVIRDDGRGFDPAALPERHDRLGLRQMRERLAAHDGWLTLQSRPGGPSVVRATLPLRAADMES